MNINLYSTLKELEQHILGIMLKDNDYIVRGKERLKLEYFNAYPKVYKEIVSKDRVSFLSLNSTNVNVDTLQEWIVEAQEIYFYDYCTQIKRVYELGELVKMGNELSSLRDLTQVERIKNDTYNKLHALMLERETDRSYHISELLAKGRAEITRRKNSGKESFGIPTGYDFIEKKLDGMHRGDYWVIGASTSVGKSTLATNLSLNATKEGAVVAYFVIEMSEQRIAERIMSISSDLRNYDVARGRLSPGNETIMDNSVEEISKNNLFIFTGHGFTLDRIWLECKKIQAKHGLDIVIVDYLQQVKGDFGKTTLNEKATIISSRFQEMAKEFNCCMVALSQLNREGAKAGKNVETWALRDSGALEMDADVVVLLTRQKGDTTLNLNIAKNRNGALGDVDLRFDLNTLRITEG